jgi:regulation of enolase protein 1 (concanavalin A-like superfamily)
VKSLYALYALLTAALVGGPAVAQNWQTVTSKEGGFTVEMPAKPSMSRSRTRTGSSGKVTTRIMGCKSKGAVYLAFNVEFPTAIEKGTEAKELDNEKESWAQELNGKVASEKKVRSDNLIGLDFTIKGTPVAEEGIVTVRAREYLDGKSIYGVAVISSPNRQLPDDIGRFMGSLALGEGQVRATSKAEPEPVGVDIEGWGVAVDPDKDCKFTPDKTGLSLSLPGTWHDLNPETGKNNSPRLLRSVGGDFQITTKVIGDFKPGTKSFNPKGVPYNGAGIVVWHNPDNFIRLERGSVNRGGKLASFLLFEEREAGYRGAVHNAGFPGGMGGDVYLRIERKGSRILGLYSFDGKKWVALQPIDTLWPTRLKVGLEAINSGNEPMPVRFEEFALNTPKTK